MSWKYEVVAMYSYQVEQWAGQNVHDEGNKHVLCNIITDSKIVTIFGNIWIITISRATNYVLYWWIWW